MVPMSALSEQYLVVGSFIGEQRARVEGARLAGASGMEVYLHTGVEKFRLVTPVEKASDSSRRMQLASIGITDSWSLVIDDTSELEPMFAPIESALMSNIEPVIEQQVLPPIDDGLLSDEELNEISALLAETDTLVPTDKDSGRFLVAGAYSLEENATAAILGLGRLASRATVRLADASGQDVYRILVGPVDQEDEQPLRAELAALGYGDAWILDEPIAVIPGTSQSSQIVEQAGKPDYKPFEYRSDFNFARMQRKSERPKGVTGTSDPTR